MNLTKRHFWSVKMLEHTFRTSSLIRQVLPAYVQARPKQKHLVEKMIAIILEKLLIEYNAYKILSHPATHLQ